MSVKLVFALRKHLEILAVISGIKYIELLKRKPSRKPHSSVPRALIILQDVWKSLRLLTVAQNEANFSCSLSVVVPGLIVTVGLLRKLLRS